MLQLGVTINNKSGLHARPAKTLVTAAKQFTSDIVLRKNPQLSADAKSIFAVMSLGAVKGMDLVIEFNGEDETQAYDAIRALFARNLDESD